jgi:hypothetical protein
MICTICLSTKHVAASCPKRPGQARIALAVVATVFMLAGLVLSAFSP